MKLPVDLFVGDALARYGFPAGHPLGIDRQDAFLREAAAQGIDRDAVIRPPRQASRAEIRRFHTSAYVTRVETAEQQGVAVLDDGDTPVFPGIYAASATVVGSALDGLERIMAGASGRTFQPIGGLHHARRDGAAGFCVFNDLGVVIETLRAQYQIKRVAYIDIDVHHGDGVFYAFEEDADLIVADVHEDGRSLYPGTGGADETGKGTARGTKLNIPLQAHAGDREFLEAWPRVLEHLRRHQPRFFVFQCGADGLDGDPLAHLRYSPKVHAHAARSLCDLADELCNGRIMGFGGGGYNRHNLALAWSAVLREFVAV
ncbi:MAG: acetoin utilization protein AcuC [Betaproteobacteria bacterium]